MNKHRPRCDTSFSSQGECPPIKGRGHEQRQPCTDGWEGHQMAHGWAGEANTEAPRVEGTRRTGRRKRGVLRRGPRQRRGWPGAATLHFSAVSKLELAARLLPEVLLRKRMSPHEEDPPSPCVSYCDSQFVLAGPAAALLRTKPPLLRSLASAAVHPPCSSCSFPCASHTHWRFTLFCCSARFPLCHVPRGQVLPRQSTPRVGCG